MLCRFDALSNRKKETNAFVKLSKLNIKESKNSIFRVYKAMELICNYAGINIKGPKGLLKLKGLVVIWIIVFMDWQKHGMDNEDILLSKLDDLSSGFVFLRDNTVSISIIGNRHKQVNNYLVVFLSSELRKKNDSLLKSSLLDQ